VTRRASTRTRRARLRRNSAPVVNHVTNSPDGARRPPSPARTSAGSSSWWRSSRKRLLGAGAALAAVLGVLSSGTSLFDWLDQKVDPIARPPAKIDARLTPPVLVSTHMSLESYLAATNQSATGLSGFQLAEPGFEFLIRVHLQGDQGRRLLLRWSLIDAKTDTPLSGDTYNQDAAMLRPRGPDQARQWPVWVPSPPKRGRYLLRASLVDENEMRRPVDQADSRPFAVAKILAD
jgi:hypothetical protein